MTPNLQPGDKIALEKIREIVDLDSAIEDLSDTRLFTQSLAIGLGGAFFCSLLFFVPIALAFPVGFGAGRPFGSAGDLQIIGSWITSSLVCGSIAASVLLLSINFIRTWQQGTFGQSYCRRSIQLPQSFKDSCEVIGHALGELDEYEILVADVASGHLLVEVQNSIHATNYVTVNLCSLTNGGTLVNITAAPALFGKAKMLSAFYCDRGVNSDNVDALMSFIKPFARLGDRNVGRKHVRQAPVYDPRIRDSFAPPISAGIFKAL